MVLNHAAESLDPAPQVLASSDSRHRQVGSPSPVPDVRRRREDLSVRPNETEAAPGGWPWSGPTARAQRRSISTPTERCSRATETTNL